MKLLVFGEILYDIIEGKPHMGGAPYNLAAHAAKLGAKSYLISALGKDALGKNVTVQAKQLNVDLSMVNILDDKETGVVNVTVNADGSPTYEIRKDVAWDWINLSKQSLSKIASVNWDYFCFGSLAQRTENNRQQLKQILSTGKFKKVFFDVNLRQNFYTKEIIKESFYAADIVKQNDEELIEISKMLGAPFRSMEAYATWFIKQFNIELLIITLGSKGATIITKNNTYTIPANKVLVTDTVGAGDSFSAAFLVALHKLNDAYKAAQIGCKLGAIVASKAGAVPEYHVDEIFNIA